MPRVATNIDNSDVINFLVHYENLFDCPPWVVDCIEISARDGGSNPSSPHIIFYALKTIMRINYESVDRFVNIKSELLFGKTYKERYIYSFMSRLIAARKRLDYFFWKTSEGCLEDFRDVAVPLDEEFVYMDGKRKSEIISKDWSKS